MYTTVAKTWLWNTLSGDATLVSALGGTAIYADLVPQGSAYPACVFQTQALTEDMSASGKHNMGWGLYTVKTITQSQSFGIANTIADLVNGLISGVSGTALNYNVRCWRTRGLDYTEVSQGMRYNHLGGIYRIAVFPGTAGPAQQ